MLVASASPVPGATARGELEEAAGQAQRTGTQIRRRVTIAREHGQYVRRLERRSDAATHRLTAVGDHDADLDADRAPHFLEFGTQARRSLG